jgi:F0F1-type ATP synthase membrane subunit b/b'
MNMLKLIFPTIFLLVKKVWLLPKSITNAVQQRRRRVAGNEVEAERLDRIRHPSKYLGK